MIVTSIAHYTLPIAFKSISINRMLKFDIWIQICDQKPIFTDLIEVEKPSTRIPRNELISGANSNLTFDYIAVGHTISAVCVE